MRKIFFLALFALGAQSLCAQELQAVVQVNAARIQGVDPKVFQQLEQSLTDFLNNRKWTRDNFRNNEKIICSFLLSLNTKTGENTYSGTLNIQASRPVFESDYNTALVNFVDRDVAFKFDESQTLQFDDNRVSGSDALVANLTAVMAYYTYLILGLDYDSFARKGGEEYFKKAQNIVLNAPEQGRTILGWKSSEGQRNRYWLVDQILNPRFGNFRNYWYSYHRMGLDKMSTEPEEARKTIMAGLEPLNKINSDNPSSYLLQFFFNAKSIEFVNMLGQMKAGEREEYVKILSRLDVPNAAKYKGVK